MSVVESIIYRQSEKCMDATRAYLKKAAEESIFYVALGRCLKREMAEKFGLTEDQVGGILSRAAVDLVDEIRKL